MWQKQNNQLYKEFTFKDFKSAFEFMSEVAQLAEALNHHPRWTNEWNKVQFWVSTHSVGEVTDKDIELTKGIDSIYKKRSQESDPKVTDVKHYDEVKLYADGGSRGNPGPSAGGFVIMNMNDEVIYENGKYLGITTNNQAEYHSLKGGLEAAVKMGVREIHVHMDSLLVINQMKGIFKVKNRDLWPIHEAIKALLPNFDKVSFAHVPRELNKLADSMVNQTLDARKET